MQPLASVVEPFTVQHCVHFRGRTQLYRPAERPCTSKRFCGFTTAEETRAMTCCKRDRLVQEEQLCPTAASHYVAAPPLKFAEAGEPGLGRPASVQRRPGRRVMNDRAVAGRYASLRCRAVGTQSQPPVLAPPWL